MKDIIGKQVLMKYIQSELPLSSCWCIWCSFYMLSLFMWWFCFIKFYVPIKSRTFAMALLNILIDQLGAGVTLSCITFMLVQYKLLLSGIWFTQHESIDTASLPSICLNLWCQRVSHSLPKGLIFSLFNRDKASSRPANVLSLDLPLGQSG